MTEIAGISASRGIAMGRAFVYRGNVSDAPLRYTISADKVAEEWARFIEATERAKQEIETLQMEAMRSMGEEAARIFEAHALILQDQEWLDQLKEKLERELVNIESILYTSTQEMSNKLRASSDNYLSERALDLDELAARLLNKLIPDSKGPLENLTQGLVVVGQDFLPSDCLLLHRGKLAAIVLDAGGSTSHTAILARAFEVPAVFGLGGAGKSIQNDDFLIVDGNAGKLIIDPDESTIARYTKVREEFLKEREELLALSAKPAETKDGRRISLLANIEQLGECKKALEYGAEGIGLFRTEFLSIGSGRFLSEAEQYDIYRKVIIDMDGRPVTIRTLDIGGDKVFPGISKLDDKNPLLGWRAIRFCLANRPVFLDQLRALLRASVHGSLQIMFPMISGLEELEEALECFELAKAQCRAKGEAYDTSIVPGIMIEIPSAVIISDILAERAGFFSIGTNDLVQYTIAVDRENEKVHHLARPFHLAVIRLIKMSIDAARSKGIGIAMCGEMAANVQATALLIGLGLTEFSMSPVSIPEVKKRILELSYSDCQLLAKQVLKQKAATEIERLVVHGEN